MIPSQQKLVFVLLVLSWKVAVAEAFFFELLCAFIPFFSILFPSLCENDEVPPPVNANCGDGTIGNGQCANSQLCCSQFGYCGSTAEYCNDPPDSGTGINSNAVTLSQINIQAGVNAKGDSVVVSQDIVNQLNDVTRGYSLYRQVAFVAQTIWESGSYRYTEELNAINSPFSTRDAYQDCDLLQPGTQPPDNGKFFYGRGYMQLSWCYNYKAYGNARGIDFYNNPGLVATTYAMDSAEWFFERNVFDDTGSFGATTYAINGGLECPNHPQYSGSSTNVARNRYRIFEAIAQSVGLTGYSESGCYN